MLALNQIYRTGQDRVTLGEAHIWALTANANIKPGSKAWVPEDILPKKVKPMDAEATKAVFFSSGVM